MQLRALETFVASGWFVKIQCVMHRKGYFSCFIIHRFSMLIQDSVVVALNVEPDGFGLSCTLSSALLDQL